MSNLFNEMMQEMSEKDQKIIDLEAQLAESEKKIEELKGERLKFYTDDVRRTQVINGVHFDIEQLLVFSEYVEHENWVKAEKDKELAQLKQQLKDTDKLMQEYLSKCLSLEQQLAEKEKEETKRMEDFEKECQEYYKSNQRVIDELEKVKDFMLGALNVEECIEYADQQIKLLKGDADGKKSKV